MRTYKLFCVKGGKLYPLFVETKRELPMGVWLDAGIGEVVDERHIRSPKLGLLSLRPGWHSTEVPSTDWIGKRSPDGALVQRKDTVWCECEVEGNEVTVTERYGLRTIPDGWYYFKTKPNQPFPWIISDRIFIRRELDYAEVNAICQSYGVEAQKMEA